MGTDIKNHEWCGIKNNTRKRERKNRNLSIGLIDQVTDVWEHFNLCVGATNESKSKNEKRR